MSNDIFHICESIYKYFQLFIYMFAKIKNNNNEEVEIIHISVKLKQRLDLDTLKQMQQLDSLKQHNKPMIIMCFGDAPPVLYPNDQSVIVYKNSLDSTTRQSNEFAMGSCIDDVFDHTYLENNLVIGFVGHDQYGRKPYIEMFMQTSFKKDFIIRPWNFYDVCRKSKAHIYQKEFFDNIKNNLFTFCFRGRGNFSIRFYETLMMGRIPIVINTKCVFPFEDKINYDEICIFINDTELTTYQVLENKITEYINKNKDRLLEIQKNNRKIYETYFHPNVFTNKILEGAVSKIKTNIE